MKNTLAKHVRQRGNQWFDWYPDGLKMSGCVVGNPGLKGRWVYEDGSIWSTKACS